jgi:hypothetical protein
MLKHIGFLEETKPQKEIQGNLTTIDAEVIFTIRLYPGMRIKKHILSVT